MQPSASMGQSVPAVRQGAAGSQLLSIDFSGGYAGANTSNIAQTVNLTEGTGAGIVPVTNLTGIALDPAAPGYAFGTVNAGVNSHLIRIPLGNGTSTNWGTTTDLLNPPNGNDIGDLTPIELKIDDNQDISAV